jgi:AcrR family transcriptional regulator
MYHHFAGKEELAQTAIRSTAAEMRAIADARLSAPGTAFERITDYLRRERDVLRGCPIGRLTQDPEVVATPALRALVEETLGWLCARLAAVVQEGLDRGELEPGIEPTSIAAAIVATLQGGYVLARASGDPAAFDQAVAGILTLLRAHVRVTTTREDDQGNSPCT